MAWLKKVTGGVAARRGDRRKDEDARKSALTAELAQLRRSEDVTALDADSLTKDLKAKAGDVKELLRRHTPQARQILRTLLVDKIELEPIQAGRRRGYRFRGKLTIAGLLSGEVPGGVARTVVAPTGFEPVFSD